MGELWFSATEYEIKLIFFYSFKVLVGMVIRPGFTLTSVVQWFHLRDCT